MKYCLKRMIIVLLPLLLSCTTTSTNPLSGMEEIIPPLALEQPEALAGGQYPADLLAQGKYMVGLLRCGSCHTDGSLLGAPRSDRLLAGSSVGIVFTNPQEDPHPGVVFPPNLTPDPATGLGRWNEQQIIAVIRTGAIDHAGKVLSVMPYPAYGGIRDEDARAIAAYLLSLPPVHHQVPQNVAKGQKTSAPYVHFGVYRSKK